MKKIILIIAICVLMPLIVLYVNATEVISPEVEIELKSHTKEAVEFFIDFYISAPLDYSKKIDIFDYIPSTKYQSQYGVEDHKIYLKRDDNYADWNEFEQKAAYFFTDSVASDFIKYSGAYNLNGKTYCTSVLSMSPSDKYRINDYESYNKSFKIVSINDTEAIVEFELYNEWATNEIYIETHNFSFVNTDNGWRISGGTFIDIYFVETMMNAPSFAPQTGTDVFAYAAVAAVALAAAVVLLKKRRRRA